MTEHVALYVLAGSSSNGEAVLNHIRSSDFIDEINSGEGPREECGLYNLVQLVTPSEVKLSSEKEVLEYHTKLVKGDVKQKVGGGEDAAWNGNCVLIADKDQEDLVHVLQLKAGKVEQRLKAKARSSVEVVGISHYRMVVSYVCEGSMLTFYVPTFAITGFQRLDRKHVDSRGKYVIAASCHWNTMVRFTDGTLI